MPATTGAGSRTSSSTTTSSSARLITRRGLYTAPLHPDLPDGGGYPATYLLSSCGLSARRRIGTFETDYGPGAHPGPARSERFAERAAGKRHHGPGRDQHRPGRARYVREREPARDRLRKGAVPAVTQACHVTEPVMTSFRGLAAYTLPKIDVLVSAQFRS